MKYLKCYGVMFENSLVLICCWRVCIINCVYYEIVGVLYLWRNYMSVKYIDDNRSFFGFKYSSFDWW